MKNTGWIFRKTALFLACAFTFVSCAKKEEIPTPELKFAALLNEQEGGGEAAVHKWFYFTKDGILPVDLPQNAPATVFKPWTETVRTAGAAKIGGESYMLVNRLGLLRMPQKLEEQPEIIDDKLYFTDTTVSNLVAIDGNPVFHVYRNSFFNQKASESPLPFLIQYRTDSKIFFPLLQVTDLKLPKQAETVHLMYDGNTWTAAFKTSSETRTDFDYVQFYSYEPLTGLSPKAKAEQIQKQALSLDMFKTIVCQYDYREAPERVKGLLSQIPEEYALDLDFTSPSSGTARNYIRGAEGDGSAFKAKVKDDGTYIAAVFSDGTVYFSGALPSTPLLRNGNPVAFRLPKLPDGFIYNDFVVSGGILYAAWEEDLFYQTGRAGLLAVDLKKALYGSFLKLDY